MWKYWVWGRIEEEGGNEEEDEDSRRAGIGPLDPLLPTHTCKHNCHISLVQYSAVQWNTVQCSVVKFSSALSRAVQCSKLQRSTVQYSALQCIGVQRSAVQYSAVQCSTVLPSQHNWRVWLWQYSITGVAGAGGKGEVLPEKDNILKI